MYSSFVDQDIKIKDIEGLKTLKGLNEELDYLGVGAGEVNFGEWGGFKLEGYWYEDTKRALINIAKFCTGWAEFAYEEGYNFRIIFKRGKVYIKYGVVDWDTVKEVKLE